MVHEEYRDMMTAKALGSLDQGEARLLETHLASCTDCLSIMDELQETATLLAFAATPMEPSPNVRSQILSAIRPESSAAQEKPAKAPVVQMPTRAATSWSAAQRWGAIAAGLVMTALAIALFVLWKQNLDAKRDLASISTQMEEMRQQLARKQEAESILTAPGARIAGLSGTEMAPSAVGTIAFDQTGRAVLMAKSLPPPPSGKAYQLWFISGGQKIPGKVFMTNEKGEGALSDRIPPQALNSSVFAITLEPESGVTQPTGQIYLVSGS
ncbi:MAG TPA: anti-sigma factor [Pyrinomonadaceae bacterium]|jgi:anti-sigma-K factor RskA